MMNCPKDKIINPGTGRCVLKSGKIGRKLIEGACADDMIVNPLTHRCVKKTGKIGMELMKKKSKSSTKKTSVKKSKSSTKKTSVKKSKSSTKKKSVKKSKSSTKKTSVKSSTKKYKKKTSDKGEEVYEPTKKYKKKTSDKDEEVYDPYLILTPCDKSMGPMRKRKIHKLKDNNYAFFKKEYAYSEKNGFKSFLSKMPFNKKMHKELNLDRFRSYTVINTNDVHHTMQYLSSLVGDYKGNGFYKTEVHHADYGVVTIIMYD